MKLVKLCLAIACASGFVTASFAQEAQIRKPLGSMGYPVQTSGGFLLLPSASDANPSDEASASTVSTGTIKVTFAITVSSAIAPTAKIACTATVQIVEGAFETVDTASALAIRNTSNGTASCLVQIPYSWNLANASKDSVILGYELDAPVEASGTAVYPSRHTTGWIANIAVPANGTTTPETVNATF